MRILKWINKKFDQITISQWIVMALIFVIVTMSQALFARSGVSMEAALDLEREVRYDMDKVKNDFVKLQERQKRHEDMIFYRERYKRWMKEVGK